MGIVKICTIFCEKHDVNTIHTPLTPQTKNMIGEAELRMMKKDGILINCARGGIVDEAALNKALDENWIHSAGTDVVVHEPIDPADPIFHHDNIVVTPHMAGQTREAASGVATLAAEGTVAVISGQKWDKVCNPKAYEHPRWNKYWRDAARGMCNKKHETIANIRERPFPLMQ